MTEIAYIKEGRLDGEPLGGGMEAAATRKRPVLRPSYQSGPASGVATVSVVNVGPLPRRNIAGGDMLTLIMDASP
jgi:hypothetical protein